MSRRTLVIIALIALIAVGGIGWYLFRPERLFVNQTVNEAAPEVAVLGGNSPSASLAALASGQFHSNAHETRGTATIYRLPNGKQILRLTEFETSNGPDVQVYLVAASDVTDNATVKQAGFVSLGAMKGNRGDQNYDVPANVDLGKYRAVTIWCRRFGVNFGTAPLGVPQS